MLGTDYAETHDINYDHKFGRSLELRQAPVAITKRQHLISDLRLPKIFLRLRLRQTEKNTVFGDTFLDGYFQNISDYKLFSDELIKNQIKNLQQELGIKCDISNSGTLYHLRLGDFFTNHQDAIAHTLDRIEKLKPGSTIISNQEEIFQEDSIQNKLHGNDCVLQSTTGCTSEEVLRLMSTYHQIVTNNSTLALWASVLGNCQTEFSDPRLAAVHDRFFRIANTQ